MVVSAENSGENGIVVGVGNYGNVIQEEISRIPSQAEQAPATPPAETKVEADTTAEAVPTKTISKAISLPEAPVVESSPIQAEAKPVKKIKVKKKPVKPKALVKKARVEKPKPSQPDAPVQTPKPAAETEAPENPSNSRTTAQKQAAGEANDTHAGGQKSEIPPSYLAKVVAKIQYYKSYPKKAKKLKLEGTSFLKFTLSRNGKVIAKSIRTSSGHNLLDKATLKILDKIGSFPRFGKKIKQQEMTLVIPIEYSLIDR